MLCVVCWGVVYHPRVAQCAPSLIVKSQDRNSIGRLWGGGGGVYVARVAAAGGPRKSIKRQPRVSDVCCVAPMEKVPRKKENVLICLLVSVP